MHLKALVEIGHDLLNSAVCDLLGGLTLPTEVDLAHLSKRHSCLILLLADLELDLRTNTL